MKLKQIVAVVCLIASTSVFSYDYNQPTVDGPRLKSRAEKTDTGLSPIVPTYDRTGKLWARVFQPSDKLYPQAKKPAIMILHGGGGMNLLYIDQAMWWASQGYVAIVVDSFGSRGIDENWETFTRYGANMRAADAVATARYLKDLKNVDHTRIYMFGGSQGGWTVLRTLTKGEPWSQEAEQLIAAGIAEYPVCRRDKINSVELGPFTRPVLFLQGKDDTATPIKFCRDLVSYPNVKNVEYDNATHGWDMVGNDRSHPYWNYPIRWNPDLTQSSREEALIWTKTYSNKER